MNKKLRNYITLFVAVLIAIVLTNFVIFDNVTYASVPDEKMEMPMFRRGMPVATRSTMAEL